MTACDSEDGLSEYRTIGPHFRLKKKNYANFLLCSENVYHGASLTINYKKRVILYLDADAVGFSFLSSSLDDGHYTTKFQ